MIIRNGDWIRMEFKNSILNKIYNGVWIHMEFNHLVSFYVKALPHWLRLDMDIHIPLKYSIDI